VIRRHLAGNDVAKLSEFSLQLFFGDFESQVLDEEFLLVESLLPSIWCGRWVRRASIVHSLSIIEQVRISNF
jgi:hypothetical protein